MTAEIAILNSHGVAIAADSAITLQIGKINKKSIIQQIKYLLYQNIIL